MWIRVTPVSALHVVVPLVPEISDSLTRVTHSLSIPFRSSEVSRPAESGTNGARHNGIAKQLDMYSVRCRKARTGQLVPNAEHYAAYLKGFDHA
jgi:hypothetical protein